MEEKNTSVVDSWGMDETYIKVKGKWLYLYQAIGSSGTTLDIRLLINGLHYAVSLIQYSPKDCFLRLNTEQINT